MFKTLKNSEGLVLIVVLMIVIVTTTLVISLLSLNVSQVFVAEKEVKRIQSETMGTGMLDLMFSRMQSGLPATSISNRQTIDSTNYDISVDSTPDTSSDPFLSDTINATVIF